MLYKYKVSLWVRVFLAILLPLGETLLEAQDANLRSSNLWREVSETAINASAPGKQAIQLQSFNSNRGPTPLKYRTFYLNVGAMQAVLAQAPIETRQNWEAGGVQIDLPLPEGGVGRFHVLNSPIMSAKLAAKCPENQTYTLEGIDDPEASGRLSTSPLGLQATIFSSKGTILINPYFRHDPNYNISYYAKDLNPSGLTWACGTASTNPVSGKQSLKSASFNPSPLNMFSLAVSSYGQQRRTYRLAVACNGEFSKQVTTGVPGNVFQNTRTFIINSINRITAIYERDLSIHFQLVDAEDQLIYTDPSKDPYSTYLPYFANADVLAQENQSNIDKLVGNANYEFGHLFTADTSTSGIAYGSGLGPTFGIIGDNTRKAMVITTRGSTDNQSIDFDLVAAHEMGHGSGANHVFNWGAEGTGAQVEPGSGSTIMSYAGIVTGYNLQGMMDDYFNAKSLEQISAYTAVPPGSLAYTSIDNSGNVPPVIQSVKSYVVPSRTPFALTAQATDANGDPLTYCWEEQDSGSAQNPTKEPRDNGFSPLFRSDYPSTNPTRTFPKLKYILANSNTPPPGKGIAPDFASGEYLPTTSRTLKFRLTVRDGKGGVAYANNTVQSISTAGPFLVTNPNTSYVYAVGSRQAIGWSVKNTGPGSPVNCTNVKITVSTNGGTNFNYTLVDSVKNSGIFVFNVPNLVSERVRFKVEALGNIFFDINDLDVKIRPSTTLYDSFALAKELVFTAGKSINKGTTVGASAEYGEPSHFSQPSRSVWFKYVATTSGQVSLSTEGSDFDTTVAVYHGSSLDALVKIENNNDNNLEKNSKWSKLSFLGAKDKTYYIALDGYLGDSGPYVLTVDVNSSVVSNDNYASATPLSPAVSNSFSGSLLGATAQSNEPSLAGFQANRSVWFSWKAPANGELSLSTLGSACDTVLGIYSGSVTGSDWSNLKLIAANDNFSPSTTYSRLSNINVSEGVTYIIKIDGRSLPSLNYKISSTFFPNPTLTPPTGVAFVIKKITEGKYQPIISWNATPGAVQYEASLFRLTTRLYGSTTTKTNWTNGPLLIVSNNVSPGIFGVQIRAISNNISSLPSAIVPASIAP